MTGKEQETPGKAKKSEKLKKEIGLKFRNARRSLGFSYEKIAEETKIDIEKLIRLEKGKGRITIPILIKLSKAMNIAIADLLPKKREKTNRGR
jgi:transcriptional regulator with XRE-family HTH domain